MQKALKDKEYKILQAKIKGEEIDPSLLMPNSSGNPTYDAMMRRMQQ